MEFQTFKYLSIAAVAVIYSIFITGVIIHTHKNKSRTNREPDMLRNYLEKQNDSN